MKYEAVLIALLIALGLTTNARTFDRRPMTARTALNAKDIVRTLYEDSINPGKLERIDHLVAADYVGPDGARGPAGFRDTVGGLRTGFPDIHFTIQDLIAEGNRVAIRWTWEGTHDGPFRGIAPTHRRITNSGIAIYEVRSGLIVRSWLESDRLGALQQLGIVPASAVPPKK